MTLRFIWFEWPPAHALEAFANKYYKKINPNVTVKVDTVPIANWHDAIFTQFAAKKTTFDIPVLDSQFIGEAVTNGDIVDLTNWATRTSTWRRTRPTCSPRTASTRRRSRATTTRARTCTGCRSSATRGS